MLVSAGALAAVVLYNLTNINISERVREIATIRVLGFYDMEVYKYIFRENIVLSVIGIVVGLFLGVLLDGFIIATVETDIAMFAREIEPTSFIYSVVFTLAFTFIVNILMTPIIKRISMVESLKSIE
jgi:putative ABC transport system permease protein